MDRPIDFVVIGAQKAGSTFIQKCLSEHPQIFMPKGEISYFEDPDYKKNSFEWFIKKFDKASNGQIIGFKRPNCLGKPECAKRIKRDLPKVKLIMILRNPVNRAVSAYYHQMRTGTLPIIEVNDGLERVLKGEYKNWKRAKEILEFGLYAKHLTRFYKWFDNSQILILILDEVKKEPLVKIQEVYKFVGVDDEFVPKVLNRRVMEGIYSLQRLRLWNLFNRFYYNYNSKCTRLEPKRKNLLEWIIVLFILGIDKLMKGWLINEKPKLESKLKNKLVKYYKKDLRKLEKMINKDLGIWCC